MADTPQPTYDRDPDIVWSTTTQCPTLFFIATQAAMGSKAASSINKFQNELPHNTYLETPWSRIQGTSLHEQCIQPRYYPSNSRKNTVLKVLVAVDLCRTLPLDRIRKLGKPQDTAAVSRKWKVYSTTTEQM